MGFWAKLFGGKNQRTETDDHKPEQEKREAAAKKATKDSAKQSSSGSQADAKGEGAKFSGREEETKAQKRADTDTREVIKEAEEYPGEGQPNPGANAAKAAGKTTKPKSKAAQKKTQPKPASKQSTTPKEAKPGTGKPKAGQHKETK